MTKYWNLFWFVFICSCSTLKKERTTATKENSSMLKNNKKAYSSAQVFSLFADSSAVEEEVLIWPKGVIKYAAASGFEGEVVQISIRKRDKRQIAYQKIAQEVDSSAANLTVSLQEKQQLQTVVVQKKKAMFVGVFIGGGILLVLVVYLVFRHRLFWQH